jgi:hypothetical protein
MILYGKPETGFSNMSATCGPNIAETEFIIKFQPPK